MILSNQVQKKLLLNYFNFDYPRDNITLDIQTNQLINYIMNDFAKQYEKDLDRKFVILEFQNDTISLIAYNILKNLQSILNFNLLIYGRKKVLKKYFKTQETKRKEKFIFKRTLYKLIKKDKGILVTVRHPIYKVVNSNKTFNNFIPSYNIMEKFTIEEIKKAIEFYNIPTIKASFTNKEIEDLDKLCRGKMFDVEKLSSYFSIEIPNITIVKLTGNQEDDNELLNDIADLNDLVFYHLDKKIDDYPILKSEFQFYLKNKGNIPRAAFLNINTKRLVKYLISKVPKKVTFIGNFTEKEKKEWTA